MLESVRMTVASLWLWFVVILLAFGARRSGSETLNCQMGWNCSELMNVVIIRVVFCSTFNLQDFGHCVVTREVLCSNSMLHASLRLVWSCI